MFVARWLAVASILVVPAVCSADLSPEGRWRVVSDETHKSVAIMKVYAQDGEYRAQIEKILDKANDKSPSICDKCPGSLKGHPIEGLVVMQGVKRSGEFYGGGHILDPDSGSYYRVSMELAPDGKTLNVRGYVGFSLLGRTQVWYRLD
jgi:uncharacterized protein (DUF2147 family)